jgi:CheY-like chemotaxis protein
LRESSNASTLLTIFYMPPMVKKHWNFFGERTGRASPTPLPNVILLDINMPRMNGLEFLKELREDEKLRSISVFVMTTSNDDADRAEAYRLNVAGYILKPVDINQFETTFQILANFWKICEWP